MADLTTQPYKGTRDFYPEDMRVQRYIFNVWKTVAERFGYEEYAAPLLEQTELYRAKTSEEIINEQAYNFTDRGGRELTIRPEMTPSLARMVAARQQELAYPLRWYSIANFWRYERPQHGRTREHWQLNADILGVASIEADLEIIRLAESLMRALGATPDLFTIKLNSRQLVGLLLGEHLKLDVADSRSVSQLLDRKAKMTEPVFKTQAESILGKNSEKLMNLLNISSIEELPTTVVESGVVEDLRNLVNWLGGYGIKNVEFDLTLMRGFDYYTGMVFEIFDNNKDNPRSLFGGGRYDELTGIFDVPDVPAVGFGLGDVRLRDFLETHKLIPFLYATTKAYIVIIGDFLEEAQHLASQLRKAGINTAVDITGRKAEAQLKTALKQQIPYAIFIGEKEAKSQNYTLKDLTHEKEQKLDRDKLIAELS